MTSISLDDFPNIPLTHENTVPMVLQFLAENLTFPGLNAWSNSTKNGFATGKTTCTFDYSFDEGAQIFKSQLHRFINHYGVPYHEKVSLDNFVITCLNQYRDFGIGHYTAIKEIPHDPQHYNHIPTTIEIIDKNQSDDGLDHIILTFTSNK